ncbi:UNVERIFIED_CONTAM: hypothetical protein Slati_1499000 [Sesamum latifolium]|uniref:Endonuclease/exonuclease/phosphatase domain-containing protein n=1 Tax=Sesamum latifolium TaxID=2727402 RepID=A0AAW2XB67_9LAMI
MGRSGGLFLFWRKDVEVWLQYFYVNHIDVTVKSDECPDRWRFTGFYGNPEAAKRKESWNVLRRLAQVSIRLWLVAGDFNEILSQQEKQGMLPRAQWQINDFRTCLHKSDLHDLGFEGILKIIRNADSVSRPHGFLPGTALRSLDKYSLCRAHSTRMVQWLIKSGLLASS